ncbi:hypothetical protein DPMN_124642, partial [Dreissena polymorpha]
SLTRELAKKTKRLTHLNTLKLLFWDRIPRLEKKALVNSVDPDETPHDAALSASEANVRRPKGRTI